MAVTGIDGATQAGADAPRLVAGAAVPSTGVDGTAQHVPEPGTAHGLDAGTEQGTGRPEAPGTRAGRPPLSGCRAREVLHRVGDKWSVFVIDRLGQGSQRFSELRRGIDGITGRMLTVTLRGLERDGLVSRTIHPVIPPRVDYELTPMGRTLLQTIEQLIDWADSHVADIHAAQTAYDAKHAPDAPGAPGQGDPEIAVCEAADSADGTADSGCEAADLA
jgi:DNA-binding HxlR family transcriptional regulator